MSSISPKRGAGSDASSSLVALHVPGSGLAVPPFASTAASGAPSLRTRASAPVSSGMMRVIEVSRYRERSPSCPTPAGRLGAHANPCSVSTDAAIDRFLASPGLSPATRRAYGSDLRDFSGWLAARGLDCEAVNTRALADYTAELGRARRGLAPATIARRLSAVRAFLRFTLGPALVPESAVAPRRRRRLPDAPRVAEVEEMLDTVSGDGALALRSRALLELAYSCGLRSAEAVGLALADVDFDQEALHVR